MYNGIGLQTARGSGTNGYVQRNLAFIRPQKYVDPEKTRNFDKPLEKKAKGAALIEYEIKRKIELEIIDYAELLHSKRYSPEAINEKCSLKREDLRAKLLA